MKAPLLASIVVLALTGCFAKPPNNVGFVTAHGLDALSGTYRNLGESKETGHYLSYAIWPDDSTLHHEDISAISVRAIADSALMVRALRGSDVVKQGTYVSGKDFQFRRGRIRLRTRVENTLKTPEAGGLFVARITQDLGIDQRGQGKSKKREAVIGAAFLVVPIVVLTGTEVRFARIGEP